MEERPSAGAMDVTSHHAESKTIKMKVKDLLRLQSIELPCFVQTDKTAYGLLGGEERVLSTLKTVTPSLQVQLPGSNPLSNGLPGRVVTNAPALVVKIVRRKKKQRKSPFSSISNDVEDVEVIYKSEVVGIVNRSISFSDPADYQFLPSSLNIEDYRSCQMKPILEIVPQSFARMDYTKRQALINYNYDPRKPTTSAAATTSSSASKGRKPRKDQDDHSSREHSEEDEDGEETEEDQDEEEAEKKRRKNMVVILKFGDKTPLHHPHGSHPTRWNSYKSDYRGFKLLERIRKVFTLIPVLTKQQLVDILGLGQKLHLFRECLQFAAYTYENGPFLRLYIRFGYDPTKEPSAKLYQIITCRFQQDFIKDISEKAMNHIGREQCNGRMVDLDSMTVKESPKEFFNSFIDKGLNARLPVSIFQCIIKHQISVQLFHSLHSDTFDFVSHMKTMTTCSEQTGWFTSQSTEEFRKYVKQYIVKRIVEFIALPEVTFAKSKESDGIDEEEIDKTISTIEAYLNDNQLNESDLSHMDESIKWLKKYRDAANQPYVSLYPSQRSAALHLSSTVKAASSSASKSAAPSSVPSIVAQSDSVRKRPSSSNPVPILAAAPIATSSEVYQAAQGLTNLYDTKAFQTLADSSDSEEDYY